MIIFQPVLALLGFVCLAAGYSIAGSVERMYFYYAYKLDTLTPGSQFIAPDCKDCNLNQFIELISKDKNLNVSITDKSFPDVVQTAQKIADNGLTGAIEIGQVVNGINNYATLLQKVGDHVTEKLNSGPNSPEFLVECEKAKAGVYEAMKGVYNEGLRTAVESFKPFPGETEVFNIIEKEVGRGKTVDLEATVRANPGKTEAQIRAAWIEHIAGGHEQSLLNLQKSIKVAKDLLCPAGGNRRMTKRQGLRCGESIIQDQLSTPNEAVLFPRGDELEVIPLEAIPPKGETVLSELGTSSNLAEEISEREFAELATKRGLDVLAKERWQMSLSDVRVKLNYEPLKPTSPKVGAGGFKAPSLGSSIVPIVGTSLWVYGVVNAFTHNVTALDRAAVVTAILPFVGCAVGTAATVVKGDLDDLNAALCFLGDGLLLTPAFPLGIATHVVRAIISLFKPPNLPTLEEFQGRRDKAWVRFLKDEVYSYIYSHESYQSVTGHQFRSEDKTFREKLESSLAIEELAVLSGGAQSIGAAVASAQDDVEAAETAERKEEVNKGIADVAEGLRDATTKEIIRRRRRLIMNLPKELREKHEMSLQPVANQYNDDFIKSITTESMVHKYRTIFPGDPEIPNGSRDDSDDIRAKLYGFGDELRRRSPELPRYFDLAYIVGQSRSLLSVDNSTLSIPDYIRDQNPSLSETAVQRLAIHHTLQIARLLHGKLTEDQLSTASPTEDAQGARDLQTLVALKYGRVFDEAKFRWASRNFHGATAFFLDEQMRGITKFLTQPDVLPDPDETQYFESVPYISLVTGLSAAIINSLKGSADALGKRYAVGGVIGPAMLDEARGLREMASQSDAQLAAAIAALREKDSADADVPTK